MQLKLKVALCDLEKIIRRSFSVFPTDELSRIFQNRSFFISAGCKKSQFEFINEKRSFIS